MKVKRYTAADQHAWNDFVAKAKNTTFLFDRRYMDYHSHKFTDHSLLIFDQDKLSALFVANEEGDVIHSHGGLTYGGLIVDHDARMEDVLRYFFHLLKYYSAKFTSVIYKCFPSEYMKYRSEEDLYALFVLKAELISRQASSVYERNAGLQYRRSKKETTSKQKEYTIVKPSDPISFWSKVLIPNLRDRFGSAPTHSAEEMKLLMERFPSKIHLFEIHDHEIHAGAVVYEMEDIVHTQYLSTTETGRKFDVLDVLIDHLVMNEFAHKSRFSFGTSNGTPGRKLNLGLISWKEGFGARTSVQDTYRIETSHFSELQQYQ